MNKVLLSTMHTLSTNEMICFTGSTKPLLCLLSTVHNFVSNILSIRVS